MIIENYIHLTKMTKIYLCDDKVEKKTFYKKKEIKNRLNYANIACLRKN